MNTAVASHKLPESDSSRSDPALSMKCGHAELEIGTDGGDCFDPHREEGAVLVEGEFCFGDVIASLGVTQECFRAGTCPFYRTARQFRGQQTNAISLAIGDFMPKLPPTSGTTTRTLLSGTLSISFARSVRIECAC